MEKWAKPLLGLRARTATLLTTHAATIREFRSPNMPWPGERCISKLAGLSGICYALPALVCSSCWEQGLWVVAAFLSVWADYVHIHEDSVFHGLDRVYASFTMLRCILLGVAHLEPWMLALAALPLACFVKGRDAKALPEPSAWIFWHTLWHVSGGLLVCLGTWQMHAGAAQRAPDARVLGLSWEFIAAPSVPEDSDDAFFQRWLTSGAQPCLETNMSAVCNH